MALPQVSGHKEGPCGHIQAAGRGGAGPHPGAGERGKYMHARSPLGTYVGDRGDRGTEGIVGALDHTRALVYSLHSGSMYAGESAMFTTRNVKPHLLSCFKPLLHSVHAAGPAGLRRRACARRAAAAPGDTGKAGWWAGCRVVVCSWLASHVRCAFRVQIIDCRSAGTVRTLDRPRLLPIPEAWCCRVSIIFGGHLR